LPDKPTRDAIHRYWADIGRSEADVRRCLVQLHQRFSTYALVVLYAVIHEFDAPRQSSLPNRSHYVTRI